MKKSILELYPTTKLLGVFFVLISILIVPGYTYQYAILPICMVIALLAGVFQGFCSLFFKGVTLIVLFIFIIQGFFYPGDTVLWSGWILSLKQEGLSYSLLLTSKIVAITASIILFFQITKTKDLIIALEKMGTPKKVTYVIMSTLQIIPQMRQQLNVIMDAQRSRGVETEGSLMIRAKAIIPVLGTLIISSFENTQERVITLESRAFTIQRKKTNVTVLPKGLLDTIVRIVLLLLLVLIIWKGVIG
ncbi:energy-coupling factor transporter transmembrane component T [Paenibacillus peoriae]|uniref:energy-coupling factor transporter transmembrane component T n=1 Tax=Paenibacillus peoriae TaxID=59893 RepID=UPI00026C59E2|nr:energy-coupling factor transporter transmembrane component T [Paenibacillus peoriae]MEC0182169.1 energy-coupling factor transporter transmembrane component T [Paenibacillus peoriae]